MTTVQRSSQNLVVLGVLALWPLAASGQVTTSGDDAGLQRAEVAYFEATSLTQTSITWRERSRAAQLFQESAELLPPQDPRAFEAGMAAVQIFHRLGDLRAARRTLMQAADRAIQVGQVLNAASAYLGVAEICLEMGRGGEALEFAERGRRLASSPHLGMVARTRILRRAGTHPEGVNTALR